MGLNIIVGILPGVHEFDGLGYRHYRKQFEKINHYLQEAGFPAHNEPEDCAVWDCDMYGYSGLSLLRRVAAHLDLNGSLPSPGNPNVFDDVVLRDYFRYSVKKRSGSPPYAFGFDHLINHSDCDGFYLPLPFEPVLHTLRKLNIDGRGMIGSSIQLLQECRRLAAVLEIPDGIDQDSEELWHATETQGEGAVVWQRYGIETFSCVRLINACKWSIETGAAIVFT